MTQLIYIYKSGICLEPVNTTTKGEGPREKRTSFCMHKEMWEGKIYHKGSGDYMGLRGGGTTCRNECSSISEAASTCK